MKAGFSLLEKEVMNKEKGRLKWTLQDWIGIRGVTMSSWFLLHIQVDKYINIDMCVRWDRVHTYTSIHTLLSSERTKNHWRLAHRSWFLNTILQEKRSQRSLQKWLVLGLLQGKYRLSLECLVVPENKEMLKKTWKWWCLLKEYRSQPEGASNGPNWNS